MTHVTLGISAPRPSPVAIPLPEWLGGSFRVGLGDILSWIAGVLGLKPCEACARRALIMNQLMVFGASTAHMSDASHATGPTVDIAPVNSSSTTGKKEEPPRCKVIINTFFDNTCTAGPCPPNSKCAWKRAKLKFLPGVFLWTNDHFRPVYPRDFEPTECECLDDTPSMKAAPPPANGGPGIDVEEMAHPIEGLTIQEEELQRLREGYDIELWTGD